MSKRSELVAVLRAAAEAIDAYSQSVADKVSGFAEMKRKKQEFDKVIEKRRGRKS